MKYSLILPVYNEEENIKSLYRRISQVMEKLKNNYELIFINDGSSDSTPHLLTQHHKENKQLKIEGNLKHESGEK